jgi:ribosome biogenesis ATPase
MGPVNGKGRSNLQNNLDKEILQITRKFLDEQPDGSSFPSSDSLYRYIQSSNSSLKRKPKQLLKGSIDRVLAVLEEEQDDSEELGPMELDPEELTVPERSMNFMNKSIVGAWGSSGAVTPSGTVTPTLAVELSKKREPSRQAHGDLSRKKRKAEPAVDRSPPTSIQLQDIGGVDNVMQALEKSLVLPLLRPDKYVKLNIPIPRGILLHGPPGCGKTVISRAFAATLGLPFVEIQAPSIVSGR